jgi:hypothetical protein
MSSDAYQRFLRQYRATGQIKADGYARSHFDGLTAEEKRDAFALLEEEVRFDPAVVPWLFYLDRAEATAAALDLLERERNNPHLPAFALYAELQRYASDLRYQDLMMQQYPQLLPEHRLRAVEALGRTPPSAALVAFLESAVLTELDPPVRNNAAYQLLKALQLPYSSDDDIARFRCLLFRLGSANIADRKNALAALGR